MVSSPFQNTQNTHFSNYFIFNYDVPLIIEIVHFQADLVKIYVKEGAKLDPLPRVSVIPQSP